METIGRDLLVIPGIICFLWQLVLTRASSLDHVSPEGRGTQDQTSPSVGGALIVCPLDCELVSQSSRYRPIST